MGRNKNSEMKSHRVLKDSGRFQQDNIGIPSCSRPIGRPDQIVITPFI